MLGVSGASFGQGPQIVLITLSREHVCERIPHVVVGLSYCTIRSRTRVSSGRAAPTPAVVVEFASFGDADPATPALFLHQLTDTWGDLAAVQLNVGHEVLVG